MAPLLQMNLSVARVLYSLKKCPHQALPIQVATDDNFFRKEMGSDNLQASCHNQSSPPPCLQICVEAPHQPQALQ